MWPIVLLLPSALSSLDCDVRFATAVRDVALLCVAYLLQLARLPLARPLFVGLAFYSLLTEVVDDLTYKRSQPNPRHARNWRVVQENNIYYELDRLVKQREADHTRGRPLRAYSLDAALPPAAGVPAADLRLAPCIQ